MRDIARSSNIGDELTFIRYVSLDDINPQIAHMSSLRRVNSSCRASFVPNIAEIVDFGIVRV